MRAKEERGFEILLFVRFQNNAGGVQNKLHIFKT
jgi:hypothetical protein